VIVDIREFKGKMQKWDNGIHQKKPGRKQAKVPKSTVVRERKEYDFLSVLKLVMQSAE